MANENITATQATTFLNAVREHINEDGDKLRFKLSAEAITALNKQVNFSNISVTGSSVTAMQVDYAKVVEQLANPSESESTYEIIADEIHYRNFEGKEVNVPCTVAKVTNICTSQITEATVVKLYSGCQFRKGKEATELKTSIRSESSISGLDMFTKAEDTKPLDYVVKKTAMYDTGLSATIAPQDMKQMEYFRELVVVTQTAKQKMLESYLKKIAGSSEAVLLSAYKNINRSTIDNVFTAAYSKHFGSVDPSNAGAVHEYYQTFHDYQDALLVAFPYAATAETIQFGLNARRMVISPKPIWSNMDKIRRMKQFVGGSYYVPTPIDLGILTIPTTKEIVAINRTMIDTITEASMVFVENEARLQSGYKAAKANITLPKLEAPESLEYYKLLNITLEDQNQIIDKMIAEAARVADEICEARSARKRTDTLAAIDNLFGGRV